MNLDMRPIEVRRNPLPQQNIPPHWMGIAPLLIPFSEQHGRTPTANELTALGWLSLMAQYLALYEAGNAFLALRYEDIIAQPQAVLAAMFAYCGLPPTLTALMRSSVEIRRRGRSGRGSSASSARSSRWKTRTTPNIAP